MKPSLISRHAAAWMGDRWYRRAWYVWPSAAFLCAGALATYHVGPPEAPPMPAGWAHPSDARTLSHVLATLRDQAKSDPEAMKLLRQRAAAGQPIAEFYLATLLDPTIDHAHATPERTGEAMALYRSSADRGNATAAGNLGALLAYDRPGHPADLPEAFRYLDQAAPRIPLAQRELGQMYRLGRGVAVDQAKGIDLIRTAAGHGDATAQVLLAQAYDRGTDGLTQDRHEAAMLYQRAALANHPFAQREIGIHLMNGLGVPVDREKAMAWFRRAAENGDVYAKAQLAQTVASKPASAPSGIDGPAAAPPDPFASHPLER